MMASCVLTPSLGCITPDFENQWIITNLSATPTYESKDMDKTLSLDTTVDTNTDRTVPFHKHNQYTTKPYI